MLIEMKDVCKDYPLGKDSTVRVLNNVNLSMEEGDYLAIMGPSGSGKTTLMNIIGYLDTLTTGEYLFDGVSHAGASDKVMAQVRNEKIGFIFQSFYLLPNLTALENVALPLLYRGVGKRERTERAKEALLKMGLGDRLKSRSFQLSGGQQQRVAIARAMVGEPKLLLADEPTGALDTATGAEIMKIFSELNAAGTAIIMITHAPEIAQCARHTLYIRDGILTGEGSK